MHKLQGDDTHSLEETQGKPPYRFFEQQFTSRQLTFYLTGEILTPEHYVDMVHIIRTANEHDTVYVVLNTIGGDLATGIQLINAMRSTPAKVVAVVDGTCYSMGTMLMLAADEIIVNDNCMVMFHHYTSGISGKGSEQAAELTATIEWFAELCDDFYYPFLAKEEIEKLLEGKDFWMTSKEVRERFADMIAEEEPKPAPKKKRKTKKKS